MFQVYFIKKRTYSHRTHRQTQTQTLLIVRLFHHRVSHSSPNGAWSYWSPVSCLWFRVEWYVVCGPIFWDLRVYPHLFSLHWDTRSYSSFSWLQRSSCNDQSFGELFVRTRGMYKEGCRCGERLRNGGRESLVHTMWRGGWCDCEMMCRNRMRRRWSRWLWHSFFGPHFGRSGDGRTLFSHSP